MMHMMMLVLSYNTEPGAKLEPLPVSLSPKVEPYGVKPNCPLTVGYPGTEIHLAGGATIKKSEGENRCCRIRS
jgi:hypothetical protein